MATPRRGLEPQPKAERLSARQTQAEALVAEAASARFRKEGEAWLSASYAVSAAGYALRMGDAAYVDKTYFPRMRSLLAILEPVEETRANLLIETLMDAKGRLKQNRKQDELAAFYEKRIRKAHGAGSNGCKSLCKFMLSRQSMACVVKIRSTWKALLRMSR